MVFIKDFPGGSHIHSVFGLHIPGEIQHGIQVVSQDRGLRGAKGLLFKLLSILDQFFLLLLRQMQCLDTGNIFVQLRILVTLAQFLPDGFDLLPQIIIPLVLVHVGPSPVMDLRFQLQYLNFLPQHRYGHFQPLIGVQLAKECCLILDVQPGILPDRVGQKAVILAGEHLHLNHLAGMLCNFRVCGIQGIGFPAHGTAFEGIRALYCGNRLHHAHQIGRILLDLCDTATGQTGDKHTQIFIRGL